MYNAKYKAGMYPLCPVCGKATKPAAIRYTRNTGAFTAATRCGNEECPVCKTKWEFTARIRPEDEEAAAAVLPGRYEWLMRRIRAAEKAELICGVCGGELIYIGTKVNMAGRAVHGYYCKNPRCKSLMKEINIELTEEDIKKIEQRAPKEWACPVCGAKEAEGGKVICEYKGGEICAKHCFECEWKEHDTSMGHCTHPGTRKK